MKAAILVESLTGNTWRAGEMMAEHLQQAGWGITALSPVKQPDYSGVQAADLVLVGTWVHGLFVVGHFSSDLRNFQDVVDSPAAARLARGLYWVLPNLAQFDVKDSVVHGVPVPMAYLAMTAGYGVLYIAMLLVVSMFIFSRRDFK